MMRAYLNLLTIMILLLLVLGMSQSALADSAPPWYAQGASVEASESMTQVQMVSENVLLVVEKQQTAEPEMRGLAVESMVGHVEATFVMHNHGTEQESFDVWFPLGVPAEYDYGDVVRNFAARVNEVPAITRQAQTSGEWGQPVLWATWPVTFPPGQDVILRVTYDVWPVGYAPYGMFEYVLETGAGWRGPIGEGTVTFRLPYEANESSTVLRNWGRGTCLPSPEMFTISGTDVTWHFTALEPTEEDNICLTVLAPPRWEEITAAQRDVATDPNSSQAHLRLGRALVDALRFENGGGLDTVGNNIAFAELAETSFKRALELDPNNVEVYVEYLEFLQSMSSPWFSSFTPPSEKIIQLLDRAAVLDPNNERLLKIQEWVNQVQVYLKQLTPTTPPTSTTTLTSPPSPIPTPMPPPSPTSTLIPPLTITPELPSTPTQLPTPAVILSSTPTPMPKSNGAAGNCFGALALAILLPLGFLWTMKMKAHAS